MHNKGLFLVERKAEISIMGRPMRETVEQLLDDSDQRAKTSFMASLAWC